MRISSVAAASSTSSIPISSIPRSGAVGGFERCGARGLLTNASSPVHDSSQITYALGEPIVQFWLVSSRALRTRHASNARTEVRRSRNAC
jgi:hypothetical protein